MTWAATAILAAAMAAEAPGEAGSLQVSTFLEEELTEAARLAGGILRPLPLPLAIAATVAGFVMMLFGERLCRIGMVLYLAAFLGLVGFEIGCISGVGLSGPAGAAVGAILGAALALLLRAALRWLVGGTAVAIPAFIAAQCATSSASVAFVAGACGLAAGAWLTAAFPRPLFVIGLSVFGAFAASIGILSTMADPVAGRLAYGPAQVAGIAFAAALGVLFQWHMGTKGEQDGS